MPASLQNERVATAPNSASMQDGFDAVAARRKCMEIRLSLDEILVCAKKAARDLRLDRPRSPHLERFESLSMEQARVLAKIPVDDADPQLVELIRDARRSFIAFRESVRQEISGGIGPLTENAAYDQALDVVAAQSALAADNLKSVERALARD